MLMLLRLLLLLVILAPFIWWLRVRLRAKVPPPDPATPITMVRCAHCGVHLPQPDAYADAQGHRYCSDAHRQLGPAHEP